MTAGSAPTPTEPPAPWTPPAHWPPMPAGISPDAVAHWIANLLQVDAVEAQTKQLKAATDANIEQAAEIRRLHAAIDAAEASRCQEQIDLVFRVIAAVKGS